MISSKSVAIGGSRNLDSRWVPTVYRVLRGVLCTGHTVSVGCCVGADEYVLQSALDMHFAGDTINGISALDMVNCYAICDESGKGSCSLTALSVVNRFASTQTDDTMHWLCGGPLTLPLRSRLAIRTQTVITFATEAVILFFDGVDSVKGTVGAGRHALKLGLTVVGFGVGALPLLGTGEWVPSGKPGVWGYSRVWRGLF